MWIILFKNTAHSVVQAYQYGFINQKEAVKFAASRDWFDWTTAEVDVSYFDNDKRFL